MDASPSENLRRMNDLDHKIGQRHFAQRGNHFGVCRPARGDIAKATGRNVMTPYAAKRTGGYPARAFIGCQQQSAGTSVAGHDPAIELAVARPEQQVVDHGVQMGIFVRGREHTANVHLLAGPGKSEAGRACRAECNDSRPTTARGGSIHVLSGTEASSATLTHTWTWGAPRKCHTNAGPSSRQLSHTPSPPISPSR